MTFISYAQNAEDVILWRALKQINNGFYIDVGANDPEDDSVTKAFYDRGWHGINIEPLEQHHACLQSQRQRDINLQLAAGNYNGELTLFDIPSVRGWATADTDVANQYREQGLAVISIEVPVRRLDSICAEYAVKDIHFLKIDVEGSELEVLQGMNFKQWRPWIVVIEATKPNSQESQYQRFEFLLLESQYQYTYSDGLNRYYVAQEHLDLAVSLALQPNVFDRYQFIGYQRTEADLEQALQHSAELKNQILNLDSRLQLSHKQYLELQAQIETLDSQLQLVPQQFSESKETIQYLEERLNASKQLALVEHMFRQHSLELYNESKETIQYLEQQLKDCQQLALEEHKFRQHFLELYNESKETIQYLELQLESSQQLVLVEQTFRQHSLREHNESKEKIQDLEARLQCSQEYAYNLLNSQLIPITSSLSWRITHPLRELNYYFGIVRIKCYQVRSALLKRISSVLVRSIQRGAVLKHSIEKDSQTYKELHSRQLSPRVVSAYSRLQKAIKERKN